MCIDASFLRALEQVITQILLKKHTDFRGFSTLKLLLYMLSYSYRDLSTLERV